jgi:predicted metal-dependent hydrolase
MIKTIKTKPTNNSIQFGSEKIDFSLRFSERKNLRISVYPDLSVVVLAPLGKDLSEIIKKVKRRVTWISKQKDHFRRFHPLPPERKYVSGETHLYLGRQYRLKITKNENEFVKLKGRYFYIYSKDYSDKEKTKKLLGEWYKEHAIVIFQKRMAECYEIVKRFRISRPDFRLRKMSKRWASCAKSGNILLNPDLIQAPVYCIDYVLIHELCHLKEPNHSKSFYKLLSNCLPDWESRKARLEFMVIS